MYVDLGQHIVSNGLSNPARLYFYLRYKSKDRAGHFEMNHSDMERIAPKFGIGVRQLYKWLQKLTESGFILRLSAGRYRIVSQLSICENNALEGRKMAPLPLWAVLKGKNIFEAFILGSFVSMRVRSLNFCRRFGLTQVDSRNKERVRSGYGDRISKHSQAPTNEGQFALSLMEVEMDVSLNKTIKLKRLARLLGFLRYEKRRISVLPADLAVMAESDPTLAARVRQCKDSGALFLNDTDHMIGLIKIMRRWAS